MLINKMIDNGINHDIVTRAYDFLTGRSQQVKSDNMTSANIITSTGSPQGCVLSPILFTLNVENMTTSHSNVHIIKYADDTVTFELLNQEQRSNPQNEASQIMTWCISHHMAY